MTDAKHQTTTFAYDSRNRLLSTTDPLGKVETYEYDGNDNLTKRHTPKGDDILFAYDAVNQLLSKTLPGSQVTSYAYDLVGNLTNVTDPDSVLSMAYDSANRLTTVKTDGSPNQPAVTLTAGYDLTGNRVSLVDPAGATWLRYDALNRLTRLEAPAVGGSCPAPPSGLVSRWLADGTALDTQGVNTGTLRNGATYATGVQGQAFSFDGVDDAVEIPDQASQKPSQFTLAAWVRFSSLDSTTATPGTQYLIFKKNTRSSPFEGYALHKIRAAGGDYLQLTATNGIGTTVSVRSTTAVQAGSWYHVMGTFNGTALQISVNGVLEGTTPSNGALGLNYGTRPLFFGQTGEATDGHFAGQLDDVRLYNVALTAGQISGLTCQQATTFAYDALSRRTSLTLPNGTQTTYTYDPASQVTAISHQLTALSQQINKAEYLYNAVGNRTSLTDRRGSQAFGYDTLDRLTSASHPLLATPQAFAYDPVGNRTTGGSVVNAGNQLTADANYAYQYDDNGNLTRKTLLATGNYTQYTYDAENRLTKVEDFAAGNPTPFATSTYRYDGLGRRIQKTLSTQRRLGVRHEY